MKELWLQGAVKVGGVRLRKVAGESNPADILTKCLDMNRIRLLSASFDIGVGHADAEGECR